MNFHNRHVNDEQKPQICNYFIEFPWQKTENWKNTKTVFCFLDFWTFSRHFVLSYRSSPSARKREPKRTSRSVHDFWSVFCYKFSTSAHTHIHTTPKPSTYHLDVEFFRYDLVYYGEYKIDKCSFRDGTKRDGHI